MATLIIRSSVTHVISELEELSLFEQSQEYSFKTLKNILDSILNFTQWHTGQV